MNMKMMSISKAISQALRSSEARDFLLQEIEVTNRKLFDIYSTRYPSAKFNLVDVRHYLNKSEDKVMDIALSVGLRVTVFDPHPNLVMSAVHPLWCDEVSIIVMPLLKESKRRGRLAAV